MPLPPRSCWARMLRWWPLHRRRLPSPPPLPACASQPQRMPLPPRSCWARMLRWWPLRRRRDVVGSGGDSVPSFSLSKALASEPAALGGRAVNGGAPDGPGCKGRSAAAWFDPPDGTPAVGVAAVGAARMTVGRLSRKGFAPGYKSDNQDRCRTSAGVPESVGVGRAVLEGDVDGAVVGFGGEGRREGRRRGLTGRRRRAGEARSQCAQKPRVETSVDLRRTKAAQDRAVRRVEASTLLALKSGSACCDGYVMDGWV
eukprot:355721-Chlamydomonas_euryale.AAC.2